MTSAAAKKILTRDTIYTDVTRKPHAALLILVVGEVARGLNPGCNLPADSCFIFANIHEITAAMIAVNKPEVILSPLLCPSFDCLDLALILSNINYNGRYRIMAPALPKPKVILAEIAMLCRSLDVEFIFDSERSNLYAASTAQH